MPNEIRSGQISTVQVPGIELATSWLVVTEYLTSEALVILLNEPRNAIVWLWIQKV